VKIGRQLCLLCPWAKHLTRLLLRLNGKTGSNRWQLDLKTAKVMSLSSGLSKLANKRAKLQTFDYIRHDELFVQILISKKNSWKNFRRSKQLYHNKTRGKRWIFQLKFNNNTKARTLARSIIKRFAKTYSIISYIEITPTCC